MGPYTEKYWHNGVACHGVGCLVAFELSKLRQKNLEHYEIQLAFEPV